MDWQRGNFLSTVRLDHYCSLPAVHSRTARCRIHHPMVSAPASEGQRGTAIHEIGIRHLANGPQKRNAGGELL